MGSACRSLRGCRMAQPTAVVLGLHGYGDYREAFGLAGRWLAARGVAVYAYDQRGFGETSDARALARRRGADRRLRRRRGGTARAPSRAAACAARREHGRLGRAGQPRQRPGERRRWSDPGSAGGTQRRAAAPAARPGATSGCACFALAQSGAAARRPALARSRGIQAARRGSPDPAAPERRHLRRPDRAGYVARTAVTPARLPPTLLLYGELDGTILRAGIDDLALRLGHCCTLRTYPERHHLLLHERDAADVFGECLQWLRTACRTGASRPAPAVTVSPTYAPS